MHKKCIKVNGADQPHTETGELQNSNRDVAKSVRFRNEHHSMPANMYEVTSSTYHRNTCTHESSMWNVHIWNVHTWALVATAAVATLLVLAYYAFHLLRKKMYATHPPMHKRTQWGEWCRLTRNGNVQAALKREWLRPLWLPSPSPRIY